MNASEYRDEAIRRLDVLAFMAAQGVELLATVGKDERRFRCPFHVDNEASANINTESGLWRCHACSVGGSPIDFLLLKGASYREALEEVGRVAGLEPPGRRRAEPAGPLSPSPTSSRLSDETVAAWHEAALRNVELMRWLHEHRGYSDATITRFQIGWDGQRVTIPIRNEDGKLVNVRRYLRDSAGTKQKMLQLVSGGGPDVTTRLFPGDALEGEVLLVEGEWDAMLCWQQGLTTARTVTAGAGIWNPSLTPLVAGRTVTIAYDHDDAGRKGALRVARILSQTEPPTQVFILAIPNLPEKGDVTDFFVEQQRTADELRALIRDAVPFLSTHHDSEEEEPVLTQLHAASDARLRGTRLELPVLLSGKGMTPFTVPRKFTVECDMGNKRLCTICPMQEHHGVREVVLDPREATVLSLINVSAEAQQKALRALAEAVPQCNRPNVHTSTSVNVEELRLIPEIDELGATGDTEYVSRTGYFLGHGLLANRSYRMRGYTHPHPKTQATVHLLSEAIPSQDNISAFAVNDELIKSLQIFRADGDVAGRFGDIYEDFRRTVHRIHDRLDMQIAYDLVWHSPIAFVFNGAFVRRGWVEAMVMGDSGQGKTEMAMSLLHHYRLGQRVQGEQTSGAGLIGGLEKMGDTWMLSWGRIPLNDKRLLVIDETQGLPSTQIEAMSDVRATGVAEITKIRTERTNARCRLVWLANPTDGRTLAEHEQGVVAIRELFQKPEDVRRLDFAITVASGDVDYRRSINVRALAGGEPRYSSDLSRDLVLWAWSRRPEQVTFSQAATDAILAAATAMAERFHAAIPLVEPSDQRLKLARLAAAAAARTFSTPDGEVLVVEAEHVAFVVDFLERVYAAPSMAYDEFSDSARGAESVDPESIEAIKELVGEWPNREEAIAYLRRVRGFKKSDMIDVLGWDDIFAKLQIKLLARHRLIAQTRYGYVKTAAGISILRDLARPDGGPDPDVEPGPGDAF
jgi:hypothetical protein